MKITLLILAMILLIALAVSFVAWARTCFQNANLSIIRPRRHKGVRRHWRALYLAPLLIERMFGLMGFTRIPRGGVQFANIGEGTFEHGIKSYIPDAGANSRYLLYKIGSDSDHCALCGAGDTPLGSSDDQADANNLDVPIAIKLFGAMKGMTRVITDGTVANGNRVKCAANGQVTVAVTGDVSFGIAIVTSDASSNAGDPIAIIPCLPQKYAF
jgi:hypothetical protein